MHHEMDHTPRPSTSHMQQWDLVFVPIDLPLNANIPSLLLFALLNYKPQIHGPHGPKLHHIFGTVYPLGTMDHGGVMPGHTQLNSQLQAQYYEACLTAKGDHCCMIFGDFFVWALMTKKLCKGGTRYPGMFYSILGDRVIRSGYMIDPIQIIKWKIIKIKHQQQTLGTQFCWNHVIERFVFGCFHCCHNSAVTILLAGKEVALPHQPPPLGSTQESMWLGEICFWMTKVQVAKQF